jgi:outer membrane protein OmpA-like peptidoglycan-associated protein
MASMLAELRSLVSPELRSEMTRQTHEPDHAIAKAYEAAIPACAATIADRSNDRGFINQLMDLASDAATDPDPLGTARRLASSPSAIDTTATGGWLSRLFGQNLSGVTKSLARYAGIRQSSASSLLLTCAPLVFGYLGRLIRSHNLSATDLAERLRIERPEIESALPAGFEVPGIVPKPYDRTRVDVDETTRREPQRERAAFPLLAMFAALGIAGLTWWAIDAARHQELPRQAKVENTAPNAVGTAGTATRSTSPGFPDLPNSGFPAGSIEDRLSRYLASSGSGSMKVDLDRVEFQSGSSRLTPKSRAQIGDLAAVLRKYPNATVAIAGHTDNVGSEPANLALSQARAQSVAKALTNADVAADRIRAEGYGSQEPVADNSTAAGRSQNRRVTLEVSR